MTREESPIEDNYRKLSNRAFLAIFACGLVGWLFFVHRGEDARAFVAGLSICAVGGVGAILARYSHLLAFWITLAGIGVAHVLFVLLIPWPQQLHGPGIVFSPLVVADMYASGKLVIFAVKQSGGA
jgi:hypothetical protein